MKICTDIEQSEKLAEFLPLESADMCWTNHLYGAMRSSMRASSRSVKEYKELLSSFADSTDIDIFYPCWSLTALMEILNGAAFTRDGTAPECYEATIFYTDEAPTLKRMTCTGTSYVDACYKMIMKLHEMNILSLPKIKEEQL